MKIGNRADYLVQVYRDAADEPPERAPLYAGIFTVVLNIGLHVRFVPEVDHAAPPWPADHEPPEGRFAAPAEVRWYELVTSRYCVTPDAARAGRTESLGPLDPPSTVFYVTPDEFAAFSLDLDAMTEGVGAGGGNLHRHDVVDRSVIRLLDGRVLRSPFLDPTGVRIPAPGHAPAP